MLESHTAIDQLESLHKKLTSDHSGQFSTCFKNQIYWYTDEVSRSPNNPSITWQNANTASLRLGRNTHTIYLLSNHNDELSWESSSHHSLLPGTVFPKPDNFLISSWIRAHALAEIQSLIIKNGLDAKRCLKDLSDYGWQWIADEHSIGHFLQHRLEMATFGDLLRPPKIVLEKGWQDKPKEHTNLTKFPYHGNRLHKHLLIFASCQLLYLTKRYHFNVAQLISDSLGIPNIDFATLQTTPYWERKTLYYASRIWPELLT
jgi:hypothetical protein